jgi:hypothetical protein
LLDVDGSAAFEIIKQNGDGMTDGSDARQGALVKMIGITPVDGRSGERAALRRPRRLGRTGPGNKRTVTSIIGSPLGAPS